MGWRLKCCVYKLLSALPGSQRLHALSQRFLTRSLVPTAGRIRNKVEVARRYWAWLGSSGNQDWVREGLHVDFGAGWQPTIPFCFYSYGVPRQMLIDLAPVLNAAGVAETIRVYREVAMAYPDLAAARMPVDSKPGGTLTELFQPLGIEYHAPYGDLLGRLEGQVRMITSTQVMLHIPENILRDCLAAIFRSLEPGGLLMATIHLQPLYGGLRYDAESYAHLRYSPEEWERFGSRLMYYTRLKAPDYRRLLEQTGFLLPHFEVEPGRPEDHAILERLPIHDCFARYSRDDLAARHLFFAAQKPR